MMNTIKKHHLKNLVAIAKADGRLDNMEKEFLLEKAYLLGFSKAEVEEIINETDIQSVDKPVDGRDREEQLADAILMAVIDGDVDEKELIFIEELANNFHFSKAYVSRLLERGHQLWNSRQQAS